MCIRDSLYISAGIDDVLNAWSWERDRMRLYNAGEAVSYTHLAADADGDRQYVQEPQLGAAKRTRQQRCTLRHALVRVHPASRRFSELLLETALDRGHAGLALSLIHI